MILEISFCYCSLLIYEEDRHATLMAQSAVNVAWRVGPKMDPKINAPPISPRRRHLHRRRCHCHRRDLQRFFQRYRQCHLQRCRRHHPPDIIFNDAVAKTPSPTTPSPISPSPSSPLDLPILNYFFWICGEQSKTYPDVFELFNELRAFTVSVAASG